MFRQAGVTSDTLASAAVGVTNVLGTLVSAFLVERMGRKVLMAGSFCGQALSMGLLVAGFTLPFLKEAQGAIALVGTLLYVATFALGVGPIPALVTSELLPAKVRGLGMSAALFTHWVCNFTIGATFLKAVNSLGLAGTYSIFGAVCLIGAIFTWTSVVETKGKSLEQIEAEMSM